MNTRLTTFKAAVAALVFPLMLASCASSQPGLRGVDPEECHLMLSQGVRDEVKFVDIASFSANFRDWLKATRAERRALKQSGNVNSKIGYKAFSFGLDTAWSLDKLDEIDQRFERDKTYVISNDEFKGMSLNTINVDLMRQYNECLDKIPPGSPRPVRLALEADSAEQVTFRLRVSDDAGRPRSLKVNDLLASGGQIAAGEVKIDAVLTSAKQGGYLIPIVRSMRSDGGYPEVHLWVFTEPGDLHQTAKEVQAPAPPPVPEPERFDRPAFERAQREWSARMEEYKAGKEHQGSWIRMPRAGPNSFSIDHLAVGDRIVGIHGRPGRNCDNFQFKVRRLDGGTYDSKWLNADDKRGGNEFNASFQSGEYIVGYRLKHGGNTDSIWFITNRGNEHRIGGAGGGHWIPADGSYVRGPGNNFELVGLDSVAGRNVDGLKGYFRRAFTAEELREPKLEEFPLKSK